MGAVVRCHKAEIRIECHPDTVHIMPLSAPWSRAKKKHIVLALDGISRVRIDSLKSICSTGGGGAECCVAICTCTATNGCTNVHAWIVTFPPNLSSMSKEKLSGPQASFGMLYFFRIYSAVCAGGRVISG